MKKLILILGANGIGKSTVSAEILRHLTDSAYIDSDACRQFNAQSGFNEEAIELQKNNLISLMKNYFAASFIQYIIFPYGFHGHREKLFDDMIHELRKSMNFEICTILLVCDESENIHRMKADNRDADRIRRAVENTRSIYDKLDFPRIDVTNLTPEQAAIKIIEMLESKQIQRQIT
ncbi:MAG: AAA family ATPase [Eubacteriales bacterium]